MNLSETVRKRKKEKRKKEERKERKKVKERRVKEEGKRRTREGSERDQYSTCSLQTYINI